MIDAPEPTQVECALDIYSSLLIGRAFISAIPVLGGPLDILLDGRAQHYRDKRLADFCEKVDRKLRAIVEVNPDFKVEPTEEFCDSISIVMRGATQARLETKREMFSNILVAGMLKGDWERVELYSRLLSEIDEYQLIILHKATTATPAGGSWNTRRVILIKPGESAIDSRIENIHSTLPQHIHPEVPYLVSDLIAKGLLRNSGLGSDSPWYLEPTELCFRFLDWIQPKEAIKN